MNLDLSSSSSRTQKNTTQKKSYKPRRTQKNTRRGRSRRRRRRRRLGWRDLTGLESFLAVDIVDLTLLKSGQTTTCSSSSFSFLTAQSRSTKRHLLSLISDQDRGLKTQRDPPKRASIVEAIDALAFLGGRDAVTTGTSLFATWRMLWTTEKEQLFIVGNARLFGTAAGDVLQVIDVENKTLNNVITFPPHDVFFVHSVIEIASHQIYDLYDEEALKSGQIPPPHRSSSASASSSSRVLLGL